MNKVELALSFAEKFDQTANDDAGFYALEWASNGVDWEDEAEAEIRRRLMSKVFECFEMSDLFEMIMTDDNKIDVDALASEAVRKKRDQ